MTRREVILLNGPSSAGKSSIAGKLLTLLDGEDAVVVSIDDHLSMSAEEPIWEDDVFAVMPDMCRDILDALRQGKTVIVDHVITSARIWEALHEAVSGHGMMTVLVTCEIGTLRKREAQRRDRCAGSAEASLRYLYPREGYDLRIDSGRTTPAEAAAMIREQLRAGIRNDGIGGSDGGGSGSENHETGARV